MTIDGTFNAFEIVNVNGGDVIWYRYDGTTVVAAADGAFVVPGVKGSFVVEEIGKNAQSITVSVLTGSSSQVHLRARTL
jgi:hypothetical protein